ncbi:MULTISPECIES: CRISPR-associated endonuclease Cas1 [Metallosphaera]|uniref:CRISPR-associated endonuclease Cas1 n=1 Tax=Metallosphaera cuprina (strain Ar-4) TaxID=1006006 RepID=F4G309_METCR|nr:CRISPR-associated endonuclease Cas1 [Metallosphaera cuprina]AEB95207.1 CRISPR-associated Cas1 family protein [Metallosphaera cuprina Ar-4]
MKKIAFVKDFGAYLKVKEGMIVCSLKDRVLWTVSPVEVHSIVVLATSSISSEVIRLANEYGIDLVFFKGYEPIAKLIPATYGGSLRVWLKQLAAWKRDKERYARQFIYGKLHNQWVTLRYYERKYGISLNASEIDKLMREVLLKSTVEEIMQTESEAAKVYWSGIRALLPKELGFKARRKRGEAKDLFNVSLNIGYGMLRRSVWGAVISAGLNPYLGFLHKVRPGRTSLVFDLMEEFRSPFVDRKLLGIARENPKALQDKKTVYGIEIKEEEIYTQARRLANSLLHGEEYRPFLAK